MLLIPILHFCFLRMMMRLTRIHAKNTLTMDFYAKIFACVVSNKNDAPPSASATERRAPVSLMGLDEAWSNQERDTVLVAVRVHTLARGCLVYLLSRISTCAREPNCPNLQISTSFYFARLSPLRTLQDITSQNYMYLSYSKMSLN